ncbi:TetR/AcrR family transcriptional regulator [uncultured Marinobacter sp.]|uniref:TetR/AcrR family transcriptional regulator n=1 Tax=uncultured Marinobacter sp. TaxID=187379 RepID=UPI0025EDD03F|nr:TetR/AcrR family transcriptional regulator [uncultured Marinobacter sp.]
MSNVGRPVNHAAREAKTEKIINGAIQCFLKKGFHGAGMAEISRKAGVSQANLYQYFASKNELILEIAKRYFSRDMDALRRVESASDFQAALEQEAYLTDDKTGTIMYMEILAESSRNPDIKRLVLESSKNLYSVSCSIFKKAQESGAIGRHLTPEQITHFIFSYIDGLSCHIATTDTEYSSELFRLFMQTLLKPTT